MYRGYVGAWLWLLYLRLFVLDGFSSKRRVIEDYFLNWYSGRILPLYIYERWNIGYGRVYHKYIFVYPLNEYLFIRNKKPPPEIPETGPVYSVR